MILKVLNAIKHPASTVSKVTIETSRNASILAREVVWK